MEYIVREIFDSSEFLDIVTQNSLSFMYNYSGILKAESYNKMYIAYVNDKPVGCSCSTDRYSCMVFVLPEYRKHGIGSALCQDLSVDKVDSRPALEDFWTSVRQTRNI